MRDWCRAVRNADRSERRNERDRPDGDSRARATKRRASFASAVATVTRMALLRGTRDIAGHPCWRGGGREGGRVRRLVRQGAPLSTVSTGGGRVGSFLPPLDESSHAVAPRVVTWKAIADSRSSALIRRIGNLMGWKPLLNTCHRIASASRRRDRAVVVVCRTAAERARHRAARASARERARPQTESS